MAPSGSDISDIQENLPRHLPLDPEGPVLNIGRASISRENRVRSTPDCIILIGKGRRRELRSRPTAREGERRQQPRKSGTGILAEVIGGIEPSLATAAAVGALGASGCIQDPVTGAQHCLVVDGIGEPDARTEALLKGGGPCASPGRGKDHSSLNPIGSIRYGRIHPRKLVECVHDREEQVIAKADVGRQSGSHFEIVLHVP